MIDLGDDVGEGHRIRRGDAGQVAARAGRPTTRLRVEDDEQHQPVRGVLKPVGNGQPVVVPVVELVGLAGGFGGIQELLADLVSGAG